MCLNLVETRLGRKNILKDYKSFIHHYSIVKVHTFYVNNTQKVDSIIYENKIKVKRFYYSSINLLKAIIFLVKLLENYYAIFQQFHHKTTKLWKNKKE